MRTTTSDDVHEHDAVVLRCRIGGHAFALPVPDVLEVHRAVAVDPLPGAPEGVVGVVEVRGELVAVLDLRVRLGLPRRDVSPSDALVTVALGERRLLLLVDEASGVEAIPRTRLHDAAELVPGGWYLRDVAGTPTGPLVIHDVAAFLSNDDLSRLGDALHAAADREVERL